MNELIIAIRSLDASTILIVLGVCIVAGVTYYFHFKYKLLTYRLSKLLQEKYPDFWKDLQQSGEDKILLGYYKPFLFWWPGGSVIAVTKKSSGPLAQLRLLNKIELQNINDRDLLVLVSKMKVIMRSYLYIFSFIGLAIVLWIAYYLTFIFK